MYIHPSSVAVIQKLLSFNLEIGCMEFLMIVGCISWNYKCKHNFCIEGSFHFYTQIFISLEDICFLFLKGENREVSSKEVSSHHLKILTE